MMQQCLFCGHKVQWVFVHGHYQCPICFTNAMPCCDGDNCHTNLLLQVPSPQTQEPASACVPSAASGEEPPLPPGGG